MTDQPEPDDAVRSSHAALLSQSPATTASYGQEVLGRDLPQVRLTPSHTLRFIAPTAHEALTVAAAWLRDNEGPDLALTATAIIYEGGEAEFTLVCETRAEHDAAAARAADPGLPLPVPEGTRREV